MTEDAANVVALKIPKLTSVPDTDIIQKQLDSLSPEQRLVVDAIAQLGKFLMDNKEAIKYFVTAVAYREGNDPDDLSFHIVTSPLDLAEYALAIKLLEKSFANALNIRNGM